VINFWLKNKKKKLLKIAIFSSFALFCTIFSHRNFNGFLNKDKKEKAIDLAADPYVDES
jgi:hypothetical protein